MASAWSPTLVQWPAESQRRDDLRAAGVPRLLVVAVGELPPDRIDDDEDFVLLPSSERDVAARLENLGTRLRDAIHLEDGVLRTSLGSVILSEREARAMGLLVERRGHMTSRKALIEAIGASNLSNRQLHDVMYRLRARLKPLGFDVFSSRNQGYTLGLRFDGTPE